MKNATFVDQDGKIKPYYMGCYGIGIGRTMAAIVEINNDKNGIIWPKSITPYQIHLIGLNLDNTEIKEKAFSFYNLLTTTYNLDVLFDDRENVSPGEKFATADIIGIPIRLVISKKTGDKIEYKKRSDNDSCLLELPELISKIKI